jgi:hypothetical protein
MWHSVTLVSISSPSCTYYLSPLTPNVRTASPHESLLTQLSSSSLLSQRSHSLQERWSIIGTDTQSFELRCPVRVPSQLVERCCSNTLLSTDPTSDLYVSKVRAVLEEGNNAGAANVACFPECDFLEFRIAVG